MEKILIVFNTHAYQFTQEPLVSKANKANKGKALWNSSGTADNSASCWDCAGTPKASIPGTRACPL